MPELHQEQLQSLAAAQHLQPVRRLLVLHAAVFAAILGLALATGRLQPATPLAVAAPALAITVLTVWDRLQDGLLQAWHVLAVLLLALAVQASLLLDGLYSLLQTGTGVFYAAVWVAVLWIGHRAIGIDSWASFAAFWRRTTGDT